MPKKGEKITYNPKGGKSRYPSRSGNVLRLKETRLMYNKRLNRAYKNIVDQVKKCENSIAQYKRFTGERYMELKKELSFLQLKARRHNPKQEHTVYLWISKVEPLPEGRQPRDRYLRYYEVSVPAAGSPEFQRLYVLSRERRSRRRSINRRLHDKGCEIVGHIPSTKWREEWKKLYRLLGLQ